MVRLIFFFILIIILYYVLHFLLKDMPSMRKKQSRRDEAEELVRDPYCQMYIPKQSALKKKIGGSVLYFCNQECLKNYIRKNREK